jgi:hypothetical protein
VRSTRRALTLLLLGAAALAVLLYTSTLTVRRDSIAFWAAGHLLLHHQNPYDPAAVLQLERSVGFREPGPQMVRNPPFALWIALPLGGLSPFGTGLVWTLMTVAALFVSLRLLRQILDADDHRRLLLAYLFAPAIACVQLGQYGTVVALGVMGFLRWRGTRPLVAGMCLTLAALKPHLLLPFWVALGCWIVARRAVGVAAGAILALAAATALAMWFDPELWHDYLPILRVANVDAPHVPTMASFVSDGMGAQGPWTAYVPALAASIWAAWFYASRRQWDWTTEGALVLAVSIWTAPYSWVSDQMVLLPAIGAVLVRRPRSLLTFAAIDLVALAPVIASVDSMSVAYQWMSTAWLAWYVLWTRGDAWREAAP